MKRPAVFLDRDGTLIDDVGYLRSPADLRLIPGTIEALRRLEAAGYARIVITNQSGIGRGLVSDDEYHLVVEALREVLTAGGASLTASYYCPHTPEAGCACRKPGAALYREAMVAFDLDPIASWFVGDRPSDLLATDSLGGRGALVLTGEGARHQEDPRILSFPKRATLVDVVTDLILADRGARER